MLNKNNNNQHEDTIIANNDTTRVKFSIKGLAFIRAVILKAITPTTMLTGNTISKTSGAKTLVGNL